MNLFFVLNLAQEEHWKQIIFPMNVFLGIVFLDIGMHFVMT